jgi:hypothetical protein
MARRRNSSSAGHSSSKGSSSSKRIKAIGSNTADIVKEAAALLDEEVAAGIVAARKVQRRFREENRIDSSDFEEVLQKFRGDAHDIVNLLNDRMGDLRSEQSAALMKRFVSNSHDILDLAVESVNTGAQIVNQLAQAERKNHAGSRAKRAR